MRVLALETSTPMVGVALLDGEAIVGVRRADLGPRASTHLLTDARELLALAGWRPADLDAVAASLGPGSFTGLRVGLATAKSLAWAADIALVGESSLRTLAASADPGEAPLLSPVLDARRGQVYAAIFERDGLRRVHEDIVVDPEVWAEELVARTRAGDAIHTLGDGLDRYEALPGSDGARPHPADLARLGAELAAAGDVLDPRVAIPNYVRSHGAIPPADMRDRP